MSDLGIFEPRRACRQAVAWLLLLLLAATGPASARTSQGGTPGQGGGSNAGTPQGGSASGQAGGSGSGTSDTPRDQAGAPVRPAPPPPPPPPPPGGPPAAAAPGTTPASGAASATGTTVAPPATPTPPAAAGPPGAVGGLAPSDRISVDVLQMDPEVGELHLDIANNVLSLTLDQAVEIALRRNLALILQRYIRNEARFGVPQALGIYDLNLTGLAGASQTKFPPTSQTIASQSREQELKLGLAQLFPSGGNLSFTWDELRDKESGGFSLFSVPLYKPTWTLNFTQPLLKGFGSSVTDQGILLALNTSSSNRVQFELQSITVSVTVIDAYWNLVNAREQLIVAQESLQLARDLNERNIIQVQVGTLAPLEIVQSQAAIATREQGIISAQQAIGDAADALRLAMNLPQDLYQYDILPTTPPESDTIQINLDESIKTALDNRVEVKQEHLSVDRAKINVAVTHSALLPALNFNALYNLAGASPSFGTGLSQVTAFDFPGWTVSLNFAFPLQNRAARAANAIAELEVDRFNRELEQEQKTVINEVRKAVRGIETAEKVIVAARASTGFAEKSLDAEKKRYENGMSTSFLITQIQDQLTLAKQSEVNAVVGYRTALAEYYRSIGKLLPELGVKILDPKEAVNRFTFHRADLLH
ncbi:MAG TPA: TolC family protein [Thermoanaerobaculia bacterium]|jgi:outer membrane protein TolC|nr:TolC family protein [Thermoanaerobaculia bacterium]